VSVGNSSGSNDNSDSPKVSNRVFDEDDDDIVII